MTESKESTGFNPFNATIDLTRTVQQTMRLSKTPITLNEVMSRLPSVIYGVKHPLTENIKQVNCGTKVTVTFYMPDDMTVHDIVVFEALVRAVVSAYVIGLADAWRAKKNGPPPSADSLPSVTPPLVAALESDDPAKAIVDMWRRSAYSMPNTPPRTAVDVPRAIKRNGHFYTRYHPENCRVPGKSYDAVNYRGTLFVLSDVAIDDAVDLDKVETSIVQPCKIPNTGRT